MKKILATLTMALAATGMAFAQGTIFTANGLGTQISTNGVAYGGGTGFTAGNGYIYALLENASSAVTGGDVSGVVGVTDPLDSTWTFSGIYMTNINNGALNGGLSVVDNMWAPNTTNAFMVVGWSVNFGTTWADISSALTSANSNGGIWSQQGYFGVSSVGWGEPGGGTPALAVYHIFGTSSTAQGTPIGGFTLYAVPVPEPATMALAGLGGLSLLLFRRRKS